MLLPGNEVAQVHRYLDLGAKMDVCHAPMDIICSSAVEELLSYNTGKPVMLAETGAVEPSHSGPSKFYPIDTAGILLHDILFAPFFSGSAGCGMCWHWESYVDRNNLWYHFGQIQRDCERHKSVHGKICSFKVRKRRPENLPAEWTRIQFSCGSGINVIHGRSELRDGQPPVT